MLGHALAMKAIHGGKAKNDKLDSHKIAGLWRGGMLPQAYVYPPRMRDTRDLLRRRLHLVRKRGQLRAHIAHTCHQYQLPNDVGRHAESPTGDLDASVQKSLAIDLALADHYDPITTTSSAPSSTKRRVTTRRPVAGSDRCRGLGRSSP